MTPESTAFEDFSLLFKEGRRRLVALASVSSIVALASLVVGLSIPKRFESSVVLIADSSNSLRSLMEGRSVAVSSSNRAAIVKEVIFSRKILLEILVLGGWLDPSTTPLEAERKRIRLMSRIRIDSPLDDHVRISYSDTDPQRCFQISNKLAELYLRESAAARERESQETFDFIDRQVKDYGESLAAAHRNVLDYHQGAGFPRAVTAGSGGANSRPLRLSDEKLAALRAEEAALAAQLEATPVRTPTVISEERRAEEQQRLRLAQLQSELSRLRATYTADHPDVRRVSRELSTAEERLRQAEQARLDDDAATAESAALDEGVALAARTRLEDLRRQIAIATDTSVPLSTGVAASTSQAQSELLRVGLDTTLAELLRRYESTREIYQDFLKRREIARLSRSLVAEQLGLGFRIREPAELPLIPTGLRLVHVCLAGFSLAVLAPLGLLFAIVRLDPRLRSAAQIERLARVPLLVSLPHERTQDERSRERTRLVFVALMILGVVAVYVTVVLVRLTASA